MKNFNKEEFWNPLREISPAANQDFCNWIDEYKKENNWEHLFNVNYTMVGMEWRGVKFHDLPIEMQSDIMEKYLWEKHQIIIWHIRVNTKYSGRASKNNVMILDGQKMISVDSPIHAKIEGLKEAFKYIHEQRGK